MKNANNLFSKYRFNKKNTQIYLGIIENLKNIRAEQDLRQNGFLFLDPTDEFIDKLEKNLPSKTCFLRLCSEPSSERLTLRYKLSEESNIQKCQVRVNAKESWSLGIPIVNCVAVGEDFVSKTKLPPDDLNSFIQYFNDRPDSIFDFLAKQTGMNIDNSRIRIKKIGEIKKITDNIFLCQITTTDECNLFKKPKLKPDDSDYFLISSNQISQILKLAKELKNQPIETELHELSKNPMNVVSLEESQIIQLHKFISEKNQQAILDFLPKCTAAVLNASTHRGTALHRVAAMGNSTIVTALIKHGAKISEKNENGQIALHYAVMNGHSEKKLLELLAGPKRSSFSLARACTNLVDERGRTPLYYAIAAGNSKGIEILHSFGAIAQITFPDAKISDSYLIAVANIKNPEQLKAVLNELAKYYPSTDKDIGKKCQEVIASRTDIEKATKQVFLNILTNAGIKIDNDNIQTRQFL